MGYQQILQVLQVVSCQLHPPGSELGCCVGRNNLRNGCTLHLSWQEVGVSLGMLLPSGSELLLFSYRAAY